MRQELEAERQRADAATQELSELKDKMRRLEASKPRAGRRGYDWPKFVELALRLYQEGVRDKQELIRQSLGWYEDVKHERPGDDKAEDFVAAIIRGA